MILGISAIVLFAGILLFLFGKDYAGVFMAMCSIVLGFFVLGVLYEIDYEKTPLSADDIEVVRTETAVIVRSPRLSLPRTEFDRVSDYRSINDSTKFFLDEFKNSYGGVIRKSVSYEN